MSLSCRVGSVAAVCLAIAGCGDDEIECRDGEVLDGGSCVTPGGGGGSGGEGGSAGMCADGFTPFPDGIGCAPILPAEACPPGQRAAIGSTACVPVGVTACADGLTFDATLGACAPVAATGCSGATRAALGASACVPLAGCDEAFPPPAATIFVDDDYGPGQLDATHYASLAAAVAAAPAGSVIAVDAGTYSEAIAFSKDLTIIGRCAAQVTLLGGGGAIGGVEVSGGADAMIARMTIQGHQPGVAAASGSTLRVEESLVISNREVGVVAVGAGTTVTVGRSSVRDGVMIGGNLGWGAIAQAGATLVVEESDVAGNTLIGVGVLDASAQLTLRDSIVRDTEVQPSTGLGAAVHIQLGGKGTVERSAIVDNAVYGLSAYGNTANSSELVVTDSVVARTSPGPSGGEGNGLYIGSYANVTVERTSFTDNAQSSVSAIGPGSLSLTDTTVARTQLDASGFGVALSAQAGIQVTVTRSALVDSRYYGIFMADAETSVAFDESLVRGVIDHPVDRVGNGIDLRGGAKLTARDSTIEQTESVGVMIDAASGPTAIDVAGVLLQDLGDAGLFHRLGARSIIDRSAVLRATQVALYASDSVGADGMRSNVTATGSSFGATRPHSSGTLGAGVVSGATLSLAASTVYDNLGFDVLVASAGSVTRVEGSFVRGATLEQATSLYGHGVVALDGARLDLLGGVIFQNQAIGVVFDRSSGIVHGAEIAGNAVGLHVQGGGLSEVTGAPGDVAPLEVVVTGDTVFVDNDARIGTGEVILPTLPTLE